MGKGATDGWDRAGERVGDRHGADPGFHERFQRRFESERAVLLRHPHATARAAPTKCATSSPAGHVRPSAL